MKMSLNLNLIFVVAIVYCFADQLSAQNVVMPSNIVMELNETLVLNKNDSLIEVKVLDKKEQAEQKNSSLAVIEDNNEKSERNWVKIGKMRLGNKDNFGKKYLKKHGEKIQKVQIEKEQGDKNTTHDTEHIKLQKWGKDKGQAMVKKWNWDKEHGSTEVSEKNKGHQEMNHQKSQEQKEGLKKHEEEKATTLELKNNYTFKELKEHGNDNNNQTEKIFTMKSWTKRKPDYHKYQKQLEQRAKKLKNNTQGSRN